MRVFLLVALACPLLPPPATAQSFPFERRFDVGEAPALEVTTSNGKIGVSAGRTGQIVVRGTVTVKIGVTVPANAVALAERTAANPPVIRDGDVVRPSVPTEASVRRAVTVSYQVEVPPATKVTSVSESGETHVTGIVGPVTVRTQSGAIGVTRLGGSAEIATGSGSVDVDTIAGPLSVTTSSSGIAVKAAGQRLRVRTQSGAVEATMAGGGAIDVRTGSSGVRLHGVSAETTVETGSGRIEIWLAPGAGVDLDARTGSGGVNTRAFQVNGTIDKRRVVGRIGSGGAKVILSSRSGSVKVE